MKRYFALSRTMHGMLDIAAPAFCALLWLGKFPSWQITLLSLATAFAGYTAIYTLNDLMGVRVDREKFSGEDMNQGYLVEASQMRYPLARNLLDYQGGLAWFGFWFLLALVGSWLLNPTTTLIIIISAILEIVYCLLFKVTYLRTLVSGLVKASGPMAAVFVVNPNPAPPFLLLLLIWIIFWEVGGQNVPADWNDVTEDRRVHAKTIPLTFGEQWASLIVVISLTLAVITSLFLPLISPVTLGWPYLLASVLAGYLLLIQPGFQLYQSREGRQAARLFDKASYYPLAQLSIISFFIFVL